MSEQQWKPAVGEEVAIDHGQAWGTRDVSPEEIG